MKISKFLTKTFSLTSLGLLFSQAAMAAGDIPEMQSSITNTSSYLQSAAGWVLTLYFVIVGLMTLTGFIKWKPFMIGMIATGVIYGATNIVSMLHGGV